MDLIWECLRELMAGDHLIRLRDIISSRNSKCEERRKLQHYCRKICQSLK